MKALTMAEKNEEDYERFAKWQGVTREQLGATSNLILGLATGLLGFATVLLLERKLAVSCAFGFGVTASILLTLSVAFALWCATNRLTDFRLTAKIANPKNSSSPQLEEFKEESKRLGERTWDIFRGQIWSFAIGAVAIGVGVIIQVFS
jgi:Na+/melibiose symporter-like transporter